MNSDETSRKRRRRGQSVAWNGIVGGSAKFAIVFDSDGDILTTTMTNDLHEQDTHGINTGEIQNSQHESVDRRESLLAVATNRNDVGLIYSDGAANAPSHTSGGVE